MSVVLKFAAETIQCKDVGLRLFQRGQRQTATNAEVGLWRAVSS